ncbi:putative pol Retrovirus-related Pol polyprotein from transposon-like 23 [Homarus americanus]|uniref:Putative pol Retrovirus-related Pol polyprotein from transposon-like 23 n=1 Tax=Homarus americanus TaxID=6706 RepID=A0A8J5MUJ1_HOMAM|nr:putative pol Retrovirus-related Pol polyprotein from transposon-like 23 [Homarus americanus]
MVEWMNQSSVRPAWETISGTNPTTKKYWAQWDAFRLKDGLLQRQWVTTNGLNSYVKSPQERLAEVHHQIRGALEFFGEVMKRNHDVKASQFCYTDGDKVWLYNSLRKKGHSPKLQSPWDNTVHCGGTPFRCDLPDQGKKEGSAEGSPRQSFVVVSWARAVHLGRL